IAPNFLDVVSYIIKTDGLYQGSYPNMCADRYIIAQEVAKIAKKEKTNVIAHGSTAMGNDQVRFDVAFMAIAPEIEVLTPIREMGGNREKEQEYLKEKGFEVENIHKRYSINQNILGVTYSGSEIDRVEEPDESIYLWTKVTEKKPKYLKITFKEGIPVALNGQKLNGVEMMKELNRIAGGYGFGRGFYTGDCVIGIKGHIVFEAPGVLTLIKAHTALRQLVLTKAQQSLGQTVSEQFTDLLYIGKFFEPAIKDLKAFIDSQQKLVTGTVTLKLDLHEIQPVAIESDFSLINAKIATYAQGCSWTAKEAEGFIKLYGLQNKIAASLQKKFFQKGE
ncbi:MAG: argininosuccinate synthase, partial [Patescibacteria group bacterium]|nr:argininosuccinate synthase [Patescibacteria group bacterium]